MYPDRLVLNPDLNLNYDQIWEDLKNLTWLHGQIYAYVPIKNKDSSICGGYFSDESEAKKVLLFLSNLSTEIKVNNKVINTINDDFIRFSYGISKHQITPNLTTPNRLTCYSINDDQVKFMYNRKKGKII